MSEARETGSIPVGHDYIFNLFRDMNNKEFKNIIKESNITNKQEIIKFIKRNIELLSFEDISFFFEKWKHLFLNKESKDDGVFFTKDIYIKTIIESLPNFDNKKELNILEPSVWIWWFILQIVEKYKHIKKINLFLNDIDTDWIELLKYIIKSWKIKIPSNFNITFLSKDFLLYDFKESFDIIIWNPPYAKVLDKNKLNLYKKYFNNKKNNNLFWFFIEKAISISTFVNFIIPKCFLFVSEFKSIREKIKDNIEEIIDYNKKVFNVNIETISFIYNKKKQNNNVIIKNYKENTKNILKKDYIFNDNFPIWLIYRNNHFDNVQQKITLNKFIHFRDRQITNKILKNNWEVQVLRWKNITKEWIKSIDWYDKYTDVNNIKSLQVYKFLEDNNWNNILCIPNLTNKIRFCILPKWKIVNWAVALLKTTEKITEKDLMFFNSEDFLSYLDIIKNKSILTSNIDKNIAFFIWKNNN